MEADFNHTLDFYASKTRRLRVGWLSERMKKEDMGLKDSHTFISIHNTHIPSGCLSQGRRKHIEGRVCGTPITCGPHFLFDLKHLET